ncbi:Cingulin-like 1, putative [Babesia ovis]|uniref:Cingulin-like 1, putative n=1 Tax=Babesia ovis TaxID=5869 RepID=A0A9W5TA94_BABOV|nr:Cingulin-like 1, putative [Babesia ovis]
MSTEEKYKELKRKYATLKGAVKQFHEEFERTKAELSAKSDSCVELEEQNQQLKKAYDDLTAEVSFIKSRKPVKASSSTWENALTLIKKGAQSASSDADEDTSLLYNEVMSLKTQLESSSHEKEELLKQNHALRNDNDKQAFEYNATVTELKERILALEGILKDLQDNLTSCEYRASRSASEIVTLNSTLASRNKRLEKLEDTLDSERRNHIRFVTSLEHKLRTKVMYDLRRLPLVNTFNVYHHRHMHNWSLFRHSVCDIRNSVYDSLISMFSSWHSAMRFIRCPHVVTESLLQRSPMHSASNSPALDSSFPSLDTKLDNPVDQDGYNSDHFSAPDRVTDQPLTTASSDHPVLDDGSIPPSLLGRPNDGHIWSALESYRKLSESTLSELLTELTALKTNNFTSISSCRRVAQVIRKLSYNQRLYLCLEEYVCPYNDDDIAPTAPRRSRHGPQVFIRCLRDLCLVISKLFTYIDYSFERIEDMVESELSDLVDILSSELLPGTNTLSAPADATLDSDTETTATSYQWDTNTNSPDVVDPTDYSSAQTPRPSNRTSTEELTSLRPLRSLSRRLLSILKEILSVINVFKSVVSHRLCYPKLASGFFLPLSGGSPEIVDLGSAVSSLETHLSCITEDIISLMLRGSLQSKRDSLCWSPTSSNLRRFDAHSTNAPLALTTTSEVLYSLSTTSLLSHITKANQDLLHSPERVSLSTVATSLRLAGEKRREFISCNERLRSITEELMAERTRCKSLESQLSDTRASHQDERLISDFERLLSRYRFHDSRAFIGPDSSLQSTYHQLMDELHSLREDSGKKVKKLCVYVRHLVKSVELLEDSNRQLRDSMKHYLEQYEEARSSSEVMALNYKEQLALMSEHISELNNTIVKAEYRVSELLELRMMCPACRTVCALADVVSAKFRGGCTSCSRRLVKRPD